MATAIYCHTCNGERQGLENNGDLECESCHSSFVERLGQGIEEFVGNRLIPNAPQPTALNGNEVMNQILNRVLGMGVQVGPSAQANLISVVQQAAASSGRPVEIIVRQAASPAEMFALSSMIATQGRTNQPVLPQQPQQPIPPGRNLVHDLLSSFLEGRPFGDRRTSGLENQSLDRILHHILMNEQSHRGTPPATAQAIQELQRATVTQETSKEALGECCITFEKFEVGDVMVDLACGHRFKAEAIEHWLQMHNTCPVCRITVKERENNQHAATDVAGTVIH